MKFLLSIIFLFVLFQNLCISIGSTFTNSTTTRLHGDCFLDLNEERWIKYRRPLLMQQNANEFVRASEVSKNEYGVSFESGESIRLACSIFEENHSKSKLINTDQFERLACYKSENEFSEFVNDENVDEAIATCDSDMWFNILGQKCNIYDIICENLIDNTEKLVGENCWGGKGVLLQIGFKTSESFINIIDFCHDTQTKNTYYTKFILTPNTGAQKGIPSEDWKQSDLFNDLDLNGLYANHKENIRNYLSDTEHKYFNDGDKDHFFSRGHLVAQGDFSYLDQRQATYTYSNTAPQWQTLNSKNWMTMETEIRKFATDKKNLDVYTGTYGIDQLMNLETNELQNLYLNIERDVNGHVKKLSLPVPRIFWKIVYSPSSNQAIVFLGINSPYVTNEEINTPEDCSSTTSKPLTTTNSPDIEEKDIISKHRICKDICYDEEEGWGKIWKGKKKEIKMGYSYCCEINEFLDKVQYLDIPRIRNAAILQYK